MRLYQYPISRTMRIRNYVTLMVAVAICSSVSSTAKAQDIHFSQFFEAPLLRNPSLAGIFQGDIRFQGIYRSQWGSVSVPYQTGSFNFDFKKPIGSGSDFITTGLQVLYDRAGSAALTTTSVMPALNYHKALSGDKNKYLALGVMGGLVQRRFDRSKITTNNHFDGNGYNPSLGDGEPLTNANYSYLDGSIGITFNSSLGVDKPDDNYFVGLAYHHFNRPKNSFYQKPEIELQPKIVASAGVKFTLNETAYFTIQADYSKQGAYTEIIGGALYSYKMGSDVENPQYTLHLGGFMRVKDAFIPVVKIDYHPFSVSFSYDGNISQLKTASQGNGGMELSISYIGFFDRDNSSRYIPMCPRF